MLHELILFFKNKLKRQKYLKIMVNIHESQKDWFEFILDLDLLDNYFTFSSEKNGNKKYLLFFIIGKKSQKINLILLF